MLVLGVIYYRFYDTPWGSGLTAYYGDALLRVILPAWPSREHLLSLLREDSFCKGKKLILDFCLGKVEEFLETYFRGCLQLSPPSFNFFLGHLTPFVRDVLWKLEAIPWGKVITYGELAQKLGRPEASRAIGLALSKNPLPILLPCHRVVGKRNLGGFSRYGLRWKILLLSLEISRNDSFLEQ